MRNFHPVFRHADVLLAIALAFALVGVSASINPHSAAWLMGVFTAVSLTVVARRNKQIPLIHSYLLYLATLGTFFFIVWMLYLFVPGKNAAAARERAIFWTRYFGLGGILLPVALYHFTLRFSRIKSRILHGLEKAGWAAGAVFWVCQLTGNFFGSFEWRQNTWISTVTGVYASFFMFVTLFLTLSFAIPLTRLLKTSERKHKLQLSYYLIGAAPLWIFCWGFFLIAFGIDIYPAGGVMYLFHTGVIAYAVLGPRVFDISIPIRRGLAYAILSLAVGLIYAAIIAVNSLLRAESHFWAHIAFVMIVAFLTAPLLSFLQQQLDAAFFREQRNRRLLLEDFARKSAASVDLTHVAESLCKFVRDALQPRRVSLYLSNSVDQPILFCDYDDSFRLKSWPEGVELAPEHRQTLRNASKAARIQISGTAAVREPIHWIEGCDALLIPIVNDGRKIGCLVIEAKRADEPFDDEDVGFAEVATAHAALALANARSFAALAHLQHVTSQMLDGLTAGVLVVNARGNVIHWNEAAARICQTARQPETLDDLFQVQPQLAEAIQRSVKTLALKTNEELTLHEPDRFLLLTARMLSSADDERLLLILFHDITDYKLLEAASRKRESLAQAGEAILALNHEIRNILQPMRHQVNRLAEMKSEDPILQRALAVIPTRLQALDRLLDNLKNLTRPIELRPRFINLKEVIESAWNDVTELPTRHTPRFSAEIALETLEADGHWMRHVFYNLLKNAVEATANTDSPSIAVTARLRDGIAEIEVADNGCGIDQARLENFFEPFFSTKSASGTGLGLSVCRRIIELHGGTITVQSEQNRGTRFRIRLSARVPAETFS